MPAALLHSLLILPVPDLRKTADFYETQLEFRAVPFLNNAEPHVKVFDSLAKVGLLFTRFVR